MLRSHHHPRHRPAAHAAEPPPSRGVLLGVLAIAQLMVILDISAVNVALPDLSADLAIARGDLGWTITSYSLVFGSLLLLGGRAADAIGRRRMFFAGLAVFTAASMLTAMAVDAATLFAGRAGQGLGAAMLSPAALSIITTSFHGGDRTRALAVWGAVGGAGAAVGVLLGGVLTELVDWRAIFLINMPVGMALFMAAHRHVPRDAEAPRAAGLDLRGAAIATTGLGALVYALSQASVTGWTSAQTLAIGGAGLLVLAVFALLERRTNTPLLKIQRLSDRAVGGGMLMMLALSAVLFGSFLLASVYMQEVMGASALSTGLAFLPMALAVGAGAHVGGWAVGRGGVRAPMVLGLGLASVGLLVLSHAGESGTFLTDLLPGMLVAGTGMGVALVSVSASVLTGGRDDEAGMLSGLTTTGHEIGGSLGVAVLVSVASSSVTAGGLAAGLGDAFVAAGAIAAGAGIIALVVLPPATTFLPKLTDSPRVSVH